MDVYRRRCGRTWPSRHRCLRETSTSTESRQVRRGSPTADPVLSSVSRVHILQLDYYVTCDIILPIVVTIVIVNNNADGNAQPLPALTSSSVIGTPLQYNNNY